MKKYKEIRNRHDDVVSGGSDHQMFQDLRDLFTYIDRLHETLARQASARAVEVALVAMKGEAGCRLH